MPTRIQYTGTNYEALKALLGDRLLAPYFCMGFSMLSLMTLTVPLPSTKAITSSYPMMVQSPSNNSVSTSLFSLLGAFSVKTLRIILRSVQERARSHWRRLSL